MKQENWRDVSVFLITILYILHRAERHQKCGKCEKVCLQHLQIRNLLEDLVKEFEAERA